MLNKPEIGIRFLTTNHRKTNYKPNSFQLLNSRYGLKQISDQRSPQYWRKHPLVTLFC